MTKQQNVVQLAAAKLTINGNLPGGYDLESYGKIADKIIAMFPKPDYTVAGSPLTVSVAGLEADFDRYMAGVK